MKVISISFLVCFLFMSTFTCNNKASSSDNANSSSTSASSSGNSGLQLNIQDFPSNWKVMDTVKITDPAKLAQFGAKLKTTIVAITNVVFQVDADTIQVNTIVCENSANATTAFNSLVAMVGSQNTVLLKESGAIEIITRNSALSQVVIDLVKPEKTHKP